MRRITNQAKQVLIPRVLTLIAIYISSSVAGTFAQCEVHEDAKLVPSDAATNGHFGHSVDLSDSTLVVGGENAAYVFESDGTMWTQVAKLTASTGNSFGAEVAISGDTIAIGSRNGQECNPAQYCGSVYVYERPASGWIDMTETARLVVSDTGVSYFGSSVAISGNTIVAGTSRSSNPSWAYVFVKPDSGWVNMTETCKLFPSPGSNLNFGISVSISGDTIAAVAPDGVYVFIKPEGGWQTVAQAAKLTTTENRWFETVHIKENTIVAGDPSQLGGIGRAYVYAKPASGWTDMTQTARLNAAPCGGGIGYSIGVDRDRIILSGVDDECNEMPRGAVYMYDKPEAGWSDMKPTATFIATDLTTGEEFLSLPVSLIDDLILAGAPNADCNAGPYCGSVYLFHAQIPPWFVPDPSGVDKARFISFALPCTNRDTNNTALRITLESLHHVIPPYNGGSTVPFSSFEGQVRWVGPPIQYFESSSNPIPFYASKTQCFAHYQDWSTVGLLHITGSEIVPSSTYTVEQWTFPSFIASATFTTSRWGDIAAPFSSPSSGGQPDFGDISAVVDKFKSAPGAQTKAQTLLAGGDQFGKIDIWPNLSFVHIAACVDAFKGKPYPHQIESCP